MKQFIIQNKTFLMFVFLLLVIIIFFATKKPKIVTYKSDNKVLEQIQAEQQKQIDYLRFKIDSLNKELIIKKKLDAELQSKSENEIIDLRLQIKAIKNNANAKKDINNNADLEQSFDILTSNIKKRQR
jgi:membrane peptidoglycan carboxypeptidase